MHKSIKKRHGIVIPMYDLIEYSNDYTETSGSL